MRTYTGKGHIKIVERLMLDLVILSDHMRINTGERPYACGFPGCEKDMPDLVISRTHTCERSYKCNKPGFGKSFTQSDHFTRHIKGHAEKNVIRVINLAVKRDILELLL
ncbi:hypothetical protein C1646_772583 [Rhizophagus diaphanus]|nr:hypothetical protein C1646_772583 [Rhizophagus diaphanus] [Rhizophagus sp. MUCL 43196]